VLGSKSFRKVGEVWPEGDRMRSRQIEARVIGWASREVSKSFVGELEEQRLFREMALAGDFITAREVIQNIPSSTAEDHQHILSLQLGYTSCGSNFIRLEYLGNLTQMLRGCRIGAKDRMARHVRYLLTKPTPCDYTAVVCRVVLEPAHSFPEVIHPQKLVVALRDGRKYSGGLIDGWMCGSLDM